MSSTPPSSTTPQHLRVAVLLESVQLADIVPLDFIGTLSSHFITTTTGLIPNIEHFLPAAPHITFFYLSSTLSATPLTPSLHYLPTHTYASAPRDVDLIFIGGPTLMRTMPPDSLTYLREAAAQSPEAVIMTTCIGSGWAAEAGLLEGKRATANRGALEGMRGKYGGVRWEEKRWVVDGRFWTSAGAGCGADMVLVWLSGRFGEELVGLVVELLQLSVDGREGYD